MVLVSVDPVVAQQKDLHRASMKVLRLLTGPALSSVLTNLSLRFPELLLPFWAIQIIPQPWRESCAGNKTFRIGTDCDPIQGCSRTRTEAILDDSGCGLKKPTALWASRDRAGNQPPRTRRSPLLASRPTLKWSKAKRSPCPLQAAGRETRSSQSRISWRPTFVAYEAERLLRGRERPSTPARAQH